jgi:hypothetical protein
MLEALMLAFLSARRNTHQCRFIWRNGNKSALLPLICTSFA